ncbi:hypothetical protein [Dokdonella fugitiva]|uniref:hypothetical protein n=1 Tax=Dokdonella fugitiva TaxID=328517 RepID=UPI0015F87C36|nr:hypothetical protein [Dokdonella fugitiva]MBA8883018.1 hypothetical protein [Dokdonella fugitiva]
MKDGHTIEYATQGGPSCTPISNIKWDDSARVFHGHACKGDCSGHLAGYRWAEKKGIHVVARCGKKTGSFFEGCRIYAAEHPEPERVIARAPAAGVRYVASCPSEKDECQQACDAADALKEAAESLASCAENEDITDDCSSEFSEVETAHSDYEDAVANASGACD